MRIVLLAAVALIAIPSANAQGMVGTVLREASALDEAADAGFRHLEPLHEVFCEHVGVVAPRDGEMPDPWVQEDPFYTGYHVFTPISTDPFADYGDTWFLICTIRNLPGDA